jgi:hypothetical protein
MTYWLSFTSNENHLGCAIVEASDMSPHAALQKAWALGCNPGGHAVICAIEDSDLEHLRDCPRNTLISKEEAEKYFPVGEMSVEDLVDIAREVRGDGSKEEVQPEYLN